MPVVLIAGAALATLLLTVLLALALLWYGFKGLMYVLGRAAERSNRRHRYKHNPPNVLPYEDDDF